MKKRIGFAAFLFLLALLTLLLPSCSLIKSFTHTHSYEYFYNDESHWRVCSECGEKTKENAHLFVLTETVPATEEQEETYLFECSACGYRRTGPIGLAEHVHSYEYVCDETNHRLVCKLCGEASAEEAHSFAKTESIAATCEHAGLDLLACSTCEFERTEFIPMAAHSFSVVDGSGTRKCSSCGRVETNLSELAESERYGYMHLASLEKSELYLRVYKKLSVAVADRKEKISIGEILTADELGEIYGCISVDHPEYFWLDGRYSYTHIGDKILTVSFSYLMSASEIPTAKKAFYAAADSILSGISSSMSDFEKELLIHDAIVKANTYDTSYAAPMTHTAYGALVLHRSVCDGYTKLFNYLMARAGVLSIELTGYGKKEPHAWNAVKLDGNWYMIDLTWDDPIGQAPGEVSYDYFNCTWETFSLNHLFTEPDGSLCENYYDIPVCNSETYNYFVYFDYVGSLSTETIDRVVRAQFRDSRRSGFEIRFTGLTGTSTNKEQAIRSFVSSHTNPICSILGSALGYPVGGYTYSVSEGGEVLTLSPN